MTAAAEEIVPKAAADAGGGKGCFAIVPLCRLCDVDAKGDCGDLGEDFSEVLLLL